MYPALASGRIRLSLAPIDRFVRGCQAGCTWPSEQSNSLNRTDDALDFGCEIRYFRRSIPSASRSICRYQILPSLVAATDTFLCGRLFLATVAGSPPFESRRYNASGMNSRRNTRQPRLLLIQVLADCIMPSRHDSEWDRKGIRTCIGAIWLF